MSHKNIKIFFSLIILAVIPAALFAFLDPNERPQILRQKIDETFRKLSERIIQKGRTQWAYDGSTSYQPMLLLQDRPMVASIIKDAPESDIYIMDIGAGKGFWGQDIKDFLDEWEGFPEGKKVHIISLTGDGYEDEHISSERCNLHYFGSFSIENIKEELERRGLNLENKIDLIVSRYTFLHFHDPIGTFVQAYSLLRPEDGLAFIDGFPVVTDHNYGYLYDLISFFKAANQNDKNLSFVIQTEVERDDVTLKGLFPFMVQRLNENQLELPYTYNDELTEFRINPEAVIGGMASLSNLNMGKMPSKLGKVRTKIFHDIKYIGTLPAISTFEHLVSLPKLK